ncbi:Uncharacterised protein [Nocardia africana]|uniref:Uncharacterized protein n=1 Tax=Nocardia africana TaxID=134964 RepID=A0A378WYD1_9NOCA|nr:Uncharacterised protein [Nocardia africana]
MGQPFGFYQNTVGAMQIETEATATQGLSPDRRTIDFDSQRAVVECAR